MSTEEITHTKSKNPEDYDVFDKQSLAKYTTDTGKILPGHGGLLDRIDGLIFVLPMAFLLQKIYF